MEAKLARAMIVDGERKVVLNLTEDQYKLGLGTAKKLLAQLRKSILDVEDECELPVLDLSLKCSEGDK